MHSQAILDAQKVANQEMKIKTTLMKAQIDFTRIFSLLENK